jgi:hypothetical protein
MKKFHSSFRPAHASGPIVAHAPRAPPPSPPLLWRHPTGARLHHAHATPAVRSPPHASCPRHRPPLSSSLSACRTRPLFFPISFTSVQTPPSASPPPLPAPHRSTPSRPPVPVSERHRTPLPLLYSQELPAVVTADRDALAVVENPRPKAFSTTHRHQASMVSPAAPRVPRRAPQALWVPVPAASPCLISWAAIYGHATMGVPCTVTTRRPRRAVPRRPAIWASSSALG